MMRRSLILAGSALGWLAFSTIGHAAVVLDTGTTTVTAGDPTQLGRLSRSGIPSDWSVAKAFPGTLNPATTYHYRTFTITPPAPYVQVTVDDPDLVFFGSAYMTAYTPASGLNVNYAGDAGSTGNTQFYAGLPGTNPRYFQVKVPVGGTLVLVVNDTVAANGGVGHPFRLLVESFADTLYNDLLDVSARVSVTQTGFGRNRATGLWVATMTVTNLSGSPIGGPIDVVLTNLTPGVTMTNNTGTFDGSPYITVVPGSLAPGASASVSIQFLNPSNGFINFTPVTRAGGP